MFPINRSLNFTIKSRKVTPASGLQMSINLGISGMICMHASQGQGIANLALKPNLLGNLGKNHGKTSGYGSFCVQPYLQMDGLLQQTTYVLDPLVRLVQYPSINAGFSTKITQIGKKMEKKTTEFGEFGITWHVVVKSMISRSFQLRCSTTEFTS